MLKDWLSWTLPIQGSDVARSWDSLYAFLMILSIFFFVLVIGGMLYFIWKYRASRGHEVNDIHGNALVEIVWTVVPTFLVMVIFVWGYVVYRDMVAAPGDAYEIRVIGKQWSWQTQYDDGRTYMNQVFVPVNQPVKLILSAEDVLHSFFVPSMRVKKDAVPGMYSSVWFEATVPGVHQVYCAEYCGTAHSAMLAKVYALEEADWSRFIQGSEINLAKYEKDTDADGTLKVVQAAPIRRQSLSDQGKGLMTAKGCVACHALDGSNGIGPSLVGIFQKPAELADGRKVASRDENYLRKSLVNPHGDVLKGYSPVMPTFQGQLNEGEMNALIAYIKSLKN